MATHNWWRNCSDPILMTTELSRIQANQTLRSFCVCCCARIRELLPTQTARDILNSAEAAISNDLDLTSELAPFQKTISDELSQANKRMNSGRHESQNDWNVATVEHSALSAMHQLVQFATEENHDDSNGVSHDVAHALAMHAVCLQQFPDDVELTVVHSLFNDEYATERSEHCNLLRRLRPSIAT